MNFEEILLLVALALAFCSGERLESTDDDLWPQLGDVSDLSVEGQDFEKFLLKNLLENRPRELLEKDLPGFIHDYLDGVMVRFRSRVTSLYRKMTCARGKCDIWPNTAGNKNHQDPLAYPSSARLEIVDSSPVHNCHIPNPVSSYLVFRELTTTLLVVAFTQLPVISLYELQGNGLCHFLENYDSALAPIFLKTQFGNQQFLFVGKSSSSVSSDGVDIYAITKTALELMQPLEIPKFCRMFEIGNRVCIVVGNGPNNEICLLYEFRQVAYEAVGTFAISLGLSVDHFSYKKDNFVVSTKYPSLKYSGVTVWKFEGSQLKLYQVLSDCDAKQVKIFTATGLKYLAVVCGDESYLYWWSGSQFLTKQILVTPGALSWMSFALNNENVILVLHSTNKTIDRLDVYQHKNGFYQSHLELVATSDQLFSSDPGIGAQSIVTARGYLVFVMQILKGESYCTSHSLQVGLGSNNIYDYKAKNSNCIKNFKEELKSSESRIKNIAESVAQLRKRLAESTKRTKGKSMSNEGSCDYIQSKLNRIEGRLGRSVYRTNELARDFKIDPTDVVNVNRMTVSGSLHSANVIIKSGSINGVDIKDLYKSVLSKSADQTFNGSVILEGGLAADYLDISSINGIKVKDNLALVNQHNVFLKPQRFASINVTNAVIERTVNNIDINDIFLKHRRQVVSGKKSFKKMAALRNVQLVNAFLNEVNLEQFSKEVLTVSGNQIIQSPVVFLGNVIIAGNLASPTINSVDLKKLASEAITTDTPQVIAGSMIFQGDLIVNTATLAGKLNGVDLSTLLTRNTAQTISNSVEIRGDVQVTGDVEVQTTVNGMDISEVLVTRCGNHTITGSKTFVKEISVNEFVNLEAEKIWHHYGDLQVDTLNVAELNGVVVNRFLRGMVRRSKPQTIKGRLMCDHISFSDIVTTGQINNASLENTYLTIATDQVVQRPVGIQNSIVMFHDDVTVADGKTLNGVDVSKLDTTVVKLTGDQIIRGHKIFRNVRVIKQMNVVSNNVKEHFLSHVLAQDDRKLDTLTVSGNLEIKENLDTNLLNGVQLSPVLQDIDDLYSSQVAINKKSFMNLTVLGSVFLGGRINDVDPNGFVKNVFRLSVNQEISGDMVFSKPVTFHYPLFSKAVNGKNLEESVKDLVQVDDKNVINTKVVFRNGLEIDSKLEVDYLNRKNFTRFASSLLLNNRRQQFNDSGFIDGNIYVANMKVFGEVNGRKMSDLVLLNENATFNHSVQFKAPITFSTLNVEGSINVAQKDLPLHHYRQIVANSVNLDGKLSGLDLAKLSEKQRSGSFVDGVRFGNDVTVKNLVINDGLINGINLADIRKRALTRNTPQTIYGRKTFAKSSAGEGGTLIFQNKLQVNGHVTSDIVNGINPEINSAGKFWSKEQLFKDGTHHGNIHFNGGLSVAELDEGSTDSQSVLVVDGDLNVENLKVAKVNGIDLRELVENRVTLSTNQSIYGEVEFMDYVNVRGSVQCVKPASRRNPSESATFSSDDLLDGISGWQTNSYSEDFESNAPSAKLETDETDLSISLEQYFQLQNQKSICLSTLLNTAKDLSGIIYDFKLINRLPYAHAIDYMVQDDDYLYLLLATATMSSTTCNNVQTLRCDADLASCQNHRSELELPSGFVRDMRSFKADTIDIYVYLVETPRSFPSGLYCARRQSPEGVYVLISSNKKYDSVDKIFIPESQVSSVTAYKVSHDTYNIVLSSENRGTSIYSIINGTYKILFRGSSTSLNSVGVGRNDEPEVHIFSLIQTHPVQLVAQTWDTRAIQMTYETRVTLESSPIYCLAAFSRHNLSFIVVGHGNLMSVFQYDNKYLTEAQKLNKNVKSLQILDFKGRIYLIALTSFNEAVLYRWTDLFHFVAVSQLTAPSEVNAVHLFSSGMRIYLAAMSEESNSNISPKTHIYEALVTGLGHPDGNMAKYC